MANSLVTIASQIESIETAFLAIFFEAASKMANLTESKLFVILESSRGGRKIAGDRQLKRAFKMRDLAPRIDDVELDDAENRHEEAFDGDSVGHQSHRTANNPFVSAESSSSLSSRPIDAKRKSASRPDEVVVVVPAKSPRLEDSFLPSQGSRHHQRGELADDFTIDCFDDIVEKADNAAGDGRVVDDSPIGSENVDDDVINLDFEGGRGVSGYSRDSGYASHDDRWSICSLLHENPKADAIRAFKETFDPLRGSTSMRLLTSLIWDIGKVVAAFWPEERDSRSSLLNDLFTELWRAFPCFEADSILSQRIQVGKQRYKFKSYLKHLLYNTIKNKVKKSKKTARTESPSLENLQQHKPTEIAWWNQYKNDENCEEILLLE